jgi:hypothetical protein
VIGVGGVPHAQKESDHDDGDQSDHNCSRIPEIPGTSYPPVSPLTLGAQFHCAPIK